MYTVYLMLTDRAKDCDCEIAETLFRTKLKCHWVLRGWALPEIWNEIAKCSPPQLRLFESRLRSAGPDSPARPAGQPAGLLPGQPDGQPAGQTTRRPVGWQSGGRGHPTGQPADGLASWPPDRAAGRLAGRRADRLIGRLAGRPMGRRAGELAGQPAGWAGWPVGWRAGWPSSQKKTTVLRGWALPDIWRRDCEMFPPGSNNLNRDCALHGLLSNIWNRNIRLLTSCYCIESTMTLIKW